MLSPSGELEVRYTNGKPYKWILRYSFRGDRVAQEVGLLFFNWFGRRTGRTFRNEWLSPNNRFQPTSMPPIGRQGRG